MKRLNWALALILILGLCLTGNDLLCMADSSGGYSFRVMEPMNYNGLSREIGKIRNARLNKLRLEVAEIGQSVLKKPLFLVKIQSVTEATGKDQDLTMMVITRQHGNEPAGTNAVLSLISDLLNEKRQLPDGMTLLLVPMVNPDGANQNTRENAKSKNLNRDWDALSQPETKGVYSVFENYRPQIFLDLHEFTPAEDRPFNMTYCPGIDKNSPTQLQEIYAEFETVVDGRLADEKIYCDKSVSSAKKVGWIPGDTVFAGNHFGKKRFGLSYIVETKGIGASPELPALAERVKMHRTFVETMIAFAAANRERLLTTVAGLRKGP